MSINDIINDFKESIDYLDRMKKHVSKSVLLEMLDDEYAKYKHQVHPDFNEFRSKNDA